MALHDSGKSAGESGICALSGAGRSSPPHGSPLCCFMLGWKKPWSASHICDMVAGWKFLGEFKRGRKESMSLECIVALRDRNHAEEIARKKLAGADMITAVELSRAQLAALNINPGDVRL
jgi:hypothetical protein